MKTDAEVIAEVKEIHGALVVARSLCDDRHNIQRLCKIADLAPDLAARLTAANQEIAELKEEKSKLTDAVVNLGIMRSQRELALQARIEKLEDQLRKAGEDIIAENEAQRAEDIREHDAQILRDCR